MSKKLARIRRSMKLRCSFRRSGIVRLVVHRTSRHIYAQVISSDNSKVLASASTVEQKIKSQVNSLTGNKVAAALVGKIIAERALNKGIYNVSFDRSGFRYHGRVQSLAEASRKGGMKF